MTGAAPRGGAAQVLTEANFGALFSARALSTLGDATATIAVAFGVLSITHSPTALGLVLAARFVPLSAVLLIGGVVADRAPRRRIMIGSDVVRAAVQLLLAAALLWGRTGLWPILGLQAAYGCAEGFFTPALAGLVPQVVQPERLRAANALLRLTFDLSIVAGPALAGLLVATAGPGVAIGVDAATFVASAALLSRVRVGAPAPSPGGASAVRLLADFREGWAEVLRRPWLSSSIASTMVFGAMVIPGVLVLGPQLVNQELGGVRTWSILTAAFGLGAVCGSMASLRVRVHRPAAAVAVLLAFAAVRPAALASGLSLPIVVVLSLGAGMAMSTASVLWVAVIQQHVPAGSLSRVDSIDDFVTLLLTPVGYALAGPVAAWLGLHQAMAALTVVSLGVSLATLAVPKVRTLGWVPERAMAGAR